MRTPTIGGPPRGPLEPLAQAGVYTGLYRQFVRTTEADSADDEEDDL